MNNPVFQLISKNEFANKWIYIKKNKYELENIYKKVEHILNNESREHLSVSDDLTSDVGSEISTANSNIDQVHLLNKRKASVIAQIEELKQQIDIAEKAKRKIIRKITIAFIILIALFSAFAILIINIAKQAAI